VFRDLWHQLALDDRHTWWLLFATVFMALVARFWWTRHGRLFDGDNGDSDQEQAGGEEKSGP